MQQITRLSYRGDTRDQATMERHGGFVPQYLLRDHDGGFEGFLACERKTDGVMGCGCAGFGQLDLYNKARRKFEKIIEKPIEVQQHVIRNDMGLLSTANHHDEAYGSHQYIIRARVYDFAIKEAMQRYRVKILPPNKFGVDPYKLVADWHVYIDTTNIGNSTLLAITPKGGVELTFISPIAISNLKYDGYINPH